MGDGVIPVDRPAIRIELNAVCKRVPSHVASPFPDPKTQAEHEQDSEGWHAPQKGGKGYFLRVEGNHKVSFSLLACMASAIQSSATYRSVIKRGRYARGEYRHQC